MTSHKAGFLADVNVLVALVDENHEHHAQATQWFELAMQHDWGVCPLTGTGFMRLMTNPRIGALTVEEGDSVMKALQDQPGYRFWPITEDWDTLVSPVVERVFGHQQITDAYLLGLAIKAGGVLVTLDRAIRHMAGVRYSENVLVLE